MARSLDAEKPAAKQQRRQTAVMAIISGGQSAGPLSLDRSTLAGLEAALHLFDHIDPPLAADQTVVAVATTQRFKQFTDLHGSNPDVSKGRFDWPRSWQNGLYPA